MIFENARYFNEEKLPDQIADILVEIDGVLSWVPQSEDNRHYAEILKQVEAGDLTIADAE